MKIHLYTKSAGEPGRQIAALHMEMVYNAKFCIDKRIRC